MNNSGSYTPSKSSRHAAVSRLLETPATPESGSAAGSYRMPAMPSPIHKLSDERPLSPLADINLETESKVCAPVDASRSKRKGARVRLELGALKRV